MKVNWFEFSFWRALPFHPVIFFLSLLVFLSSSHLSLQPDLNTNPTRPDPEGESSPPHADRRMESPAQRDADRRPTTPKKSDITPQSQPGTPASPVHRSKQGKQKGFLRCCLLSSFRVGPRFQIKYYYWSEPSLVLSMDSLFLNWISYLFYYANVLGCCEKLS